MLRILIDEPNVSESNTERLDPRRASPYKEREDPIFWNERSEKLEPI
jgi:hypothetical protein